MSDTVTGGCQCGRVRYSVRVDDAGEPWGDAYLCHCRMCQRATGGVSIAFKQVAKAGLTWTTEPERYASSGFSKRGFCAKCGTPLTYESDGHDRMDLTVGSFDDPGQFRPVSHSGAESWHAAWLDTSHLPATRTADNARIVARWMETLGHIPD